MARHLSTKQLTSWLNGKPDHPEHDAHIDSCAKCAARVEQLDSDMNNVRAISEEFRPALLAVLAPPENLHVRISERIAERLQSQSDVTLFGSLLGVPVETMKVVGDASTETDDSNTAELNTETD